MSTPETKSTPDWMILVCLLLLICFPPIIVALIFFVPIAGVVGTGAVLKHKEESKKGSRS